MKKGHVALMLYRVTDLSLTEILLKLFGLPFGIVLYSRCNEI